MTKPHPQYYEKVIGLRLYECCDPSCAWYGHFCTRYKKRLELVQTRVGVAFTGDAERIRLLKCKD